TPKSALVVLDHSIRWVERSKSHTPMPDPSIPSRKRSFRAGSSDVACWMVVTFGLHCRAGLKDIKMPDGRPAACRTSFCRMIRASALCDLGKAADLRFLDLPQFLPRPPA